MLLLSSARQHQLQTGRNRTSRTFLVPIFGVNVKREFEVVDFLDGEAVIQRLGNFGRNGLHDSFVVARANFREDHSEHRAVPVPPHQVRVPHRPRHCGDQPRQQTVLMTRFHLLSAIQKHQHETAARTFGALTFHGQHPGKKRLESIASSADPSRAMEVQSSERRCDWVPGVLFTFISRRFSDVSVQPARRTFRRAG